MVTKVMERGRAEFRVSNFEFRIFFFYVVLVASVLSTLTGCGRQVARESAPAPDPLATGPQPGTTTAPRPWAVPAIDAAGGLSNWTRCTKLELRGIVAAYRQDGSYYLTEHNFEIYPWSAAIRVSAREPGASFEYQLSPAAYRPPAEDPNRDVSPLHPLYRDYAEAVLQITTAPVRLLEESAVLTQTPSAVQIGGRWYQPMTARFTPAKPDSQGQWLKKPAIVEPYWTQGIYYESQDKSLVDMIWLGNPGAQRFLLVRGYDYVPRADGVQVPTRIEIYQSDAEANLGPQLALVNLQLQGT
jgi:hypothetical protein